MHLNTLLLPDLFAMPLMMSLLFSIKRRYMSANGLDASMLGLLFIFLEIVAHAFYQKGGPGQSFLHSSALDCYALAAMSFMYAATGQKRSHRRNLSYMIPNTIPLLAMLTGYGYGVQSRLYFETVAIVGIVLGIASVWRVRLTLWNACVYLFMWGPLWLSAHRGDIRNMAYGMLFFLFCLVAIAYSESLPRGSRGRDVVVAGFSCWAIIFLVHPAVSNMKAVSPMMNQLWDMQKFIIIIGLLVVLLEQQLTDNQWRALHDELTGLPNRRLFDDRLSQALQLTERYGGTTALLIIDLNGFKEVNDTMGHLAGDELLAKVASRLQTALRQTDTVARIGGDEFGVIVTGLSDIAQAHRIIAKVTLALHAPVVLSKYGNVQVGGAVGMALFPEDAKDEATLQSVADARMYAHKREQGRMSVTTASA